MSQEYIELRGSGACELRRVDRILAELARPVIDEDAMPPATRESHLHLGICVGGEASRKDLIARVWARKRTLLRQMAAVDNWGPPQPVA
jgi:hypothetical protein